MCANHYIVGDMYLIVNFDSLTKKGRTHRCSVYCTVGPDTHLVFQDDVSNLRDGFVGAICLWCKAESVT